MNPTLALWVVVLGAWIALVVSSNSTRATHATPTFATFLRDLEERTIREVELDTRENSVHVTRERGVHYSTGYPPAYALELVERLRANGVPFDVKPGDSGTAARILRYALPVAFFAGLWLLLLRRGGGGKPMRSGAPPPASRLQLRGGRRFTMSPALMRRWTSCARSWSSSRHPAGLRRSARGFPRSAPVGPAWHGEDTARTRGAGEAGVPFFAISGSDFVEMFVTAGADDLERVTATARQMVLRLGMSDKLGPRVFGRGPEQPFVGRGRPVRGNRSQQTAREIDAEIRRLVGEADQRARSILVRHRDSLTRLAEILLVQETISAEQLEALLAGAEEANVFGMTHAVPNSRAGSRSHTLALRARTS